MHVHVHGMEECPMKWAKLSLSSSQRIYLFERLKQALGLQQKYMKNMKPYRCLPSV